MRDGTAGGSEPMDVVVLVVDPGKADPFDTAEGYRSAVEQARASAASYFSGGELVLDDAAYDALIARIAATEAARPDWQLADSPTTVVAAGVGVVGDVEHSEPM